METPKAGEWWICKETQKPVFIVGMDPEGDPVFMENAEDRPSLDLLCEFEAMYEPCPECTGWNWKPVESPDDWVELPLHHVMRENIDWYFEGWYDGKENWAMVRGLAGKLVWDVHIQRARCRRKDLPPIIDAVPKSPWQTIEIAGRKYEIREAQEVP
jgi:hypothetical protein